LHKRKENANNIYYITKAACLLYVFNIKDW